MYININVMCCIYSCGYIPLSKYFVDKLRADHQSAENHHVEPGMGVLPGMNNTGAAELDYKQYIMKYNN